MTVELNLLIAALVPACFSVPLARIGWAWRETSLAGTWVWLALAWLVWFCLPGAIYLDLVPALPGFYVGMLVIGSALVSTLGARRPGVAVWNLLIAGGFFVILSLPLLEQPLRAPTWRVDEPRGLFLALVLFVGLANYLPTRHGLAALLLAGALGRLLYLLHFGAAGPALGRDLLVIYLAVAAASWLAFLRGHGAGPFTTANKLWLAFRDRYGAVWALRVLEQTNQALRHANLPDRLTWFGLTRRATPGADEAENAVREKLRLVLQRFMPMGGA
jgi:hypothetical protein